MIYPKVSTICEKRFADYYWIAIKSTTIIIFAVIIAAVSITITAVTLTTIVTIKANITITVTIAIIIIAIVFIRKAEMVGDTVIAIVVKTEVDSL